MAQKLICLIKAFITSITNAQYYIQKFGLNYFAQVYLPNLKGRILDIGSGQQPFVKYLSNVSSYITSDFTANSKPDVVCDIIYPSFKPEQFDGIICTEVLEHLPNPLKALKNMNEIMVNDGLLYLTTPMTWGHHYEPYDFFRFTRHGLIYLFEQSGFQIIEINDTGGLFVTLLARFLDISVSILYRLFFPLKFLMKDSMRVFLISVIISPVIMSIHLITVLLDKIVPRTNEDKLGWVIYAKKIKKIG